jgi:hypothetical protein
MGTLRRLLVVGSVVVLVFVAASPLAWARGAGAQNSGEVEGVVRAVFPAQGLVVLTNGMDFNTQSDNLRHINSLIVTMP